VSTLRTFAIGTSDETRWLAGWFCGARGVLLVGDSAGVAAREADLHPDGVWRVRAAGAELSVAGTLAEGVVAGGEGVVEGFEQAATCEGTVDGAPVTGTGRRGERGGVGGVASVRDVSAWFEDGVVAVTALRPRKAKGHDQDAVHAAVIDPEGFGPVIEPRLSTVYAGDGRVRRVGMELWSEDEEAPALRLAAEASGRGGVVTAGGWALTVDWLLAHRRGQDGVGLYLLARPV
jgi:hypothetical protein